MQNKTQLVYKIGEVIPAGNLKYRSISILVFAKEGPSDELCFHWHLEPGTAYTTMTTKHNNFNLNRLLEKMLDVNINRRCKPERVIQFLERNKISQVVTINIDPAGAKEPLSFLITKEEIQAGEFIRGGETYEFHSQAKTHLLAQLEYQRNIPVSKPQ